MADPAASQFGEAGQPTNGSSPSQPSTVHSSAHVPAVHSSALRSAVSTLLERADFAARAGMPFEGRRDLYRLLGYKRTLTIEDYRARYEREGIAEAIIELYPRATWGAGFDIIEDEDPDIITKFEQQVIDLYDRLSVNARLLRADILARLGQYSAILIVVGDSQLDTQLPRVTGPDAVISLTTFAEDSARILRTVATPTDPRFLLPEYYQISIDGVAPGLTSDSSAILANFAKRVHWSRIIHVAENTLENDIYGKPALRAVWNYLDDLNKITGGGAEAVWQRMAPGMQLDLDKDLRLTTDEQQALMDEVNDYIHKINPFMRTRGVKLNMLSSSVASFESNASAIEDLISATARYPKRILFGSERGELASSQDRDNFADSVMARRSEHATPLVRSLNNRLVDHGALIKPADYKVVWREEEELNTAQKSEVVLKLAQANSYQRTGDGTLILTNNEIRDLVLGMEPIDPATNSTESSADPQPPTAPASLSQNDDRHCARQRAMYKRLTLAKLHLKAKNERAARYRRVFA